MYLYPYLLLDYSMYDLVLSFIRKKEQVTTKPKLVKKTKPLVPYFLTLIFFGSNQLLLLYELYFLMPPTVWSRIFALRQVNCSPELCWLMLCISSSISRIPTIDQRSVILSHMWSCLSGKSQINLMMSLYSFDCFSTFNSILLFSKLMYRTRAKVLALFDSC